MEQNKIDDMIKGLYQEANELEHQVERIQAQYEFVYQEYVTMFQFLKEQNLLKKYIQERLNKIN